MAWRIAAQSAFHRLAFGQDGHADPANCRSLTTRIDGSSRKHSSAKLASATSTAYALQGNSPTLPLHRAAYILRLSSECKGLSSQISMPGCKAAASPTPPTWSPARWNLRHWPRVGFRPASALRSIQFDIPIATHRPMRYRPRRKSKAACVALRIAGLADNTVGLYPQPIGCTAARRPGRPVRNHDCKETFELLSRPVRGLGIVSHKGADPWPNTLHQNII